MKNATLTVITLVIGCLLLLAAPYGVWADHGGGKKDKKDKKKDELQIDSEKYQLDFGTVTKPASGSGLIVVKNNGDIDASRTTLHVVSDDTENGKNKVKGDDDEKIMINYTGSSAGGFQLKDFDVEYYKYGHFIDDGSPGSEFGPFPVKDKGKYLEHGATLVLNSSVTPGTHYIPYQITVRYQPCPYNNSNDCSDTVDRLAVVKIMQPLNIACGDDMDFKTILKPTTDSTIKLSTNGAMTVKKGNVIFIEGTQGIPATFIIEGDPGEHISVEADFVSAPPGLELKKFRGKYGGKEEKIDKSKKFKLLSGSNELVVGAELKIKANDVQTGQHKMIYEVDINYD